MSRIIGFHDGGTAIVPERALAFYPEQLSIEEAASILISHECF